MSEKPEKKENEFEEILEVLLGSRSLNCNVIRVSATEAIVPLNPTAYDERFAKKPSERDIELYLREGDKFREVYEMNGHAASNGLAILVHVQKEEGIIPPLRPSDKAIRALCEKTREKLPAYIK